MKPEDYDHPLFAAADTSELKQHLDALNSEYDPEPTSQAFRILRELQTLGWVGRGLRLDTKYGLASYCYHSSLTDIFRVRFDGDSSSTGISPGSIRTFWFEMD